MGLFAPLRNYVDTLVHPSAQQHALIAARHRAFIAPRLLASIVALAAAPIYIAARQVPSAVEPMIFAWPIIVLLPAYFLSRTGRYEGAQVLSSLFLTGLVTAVAALTGGICSFAAIWLVIVPIETTLSAARRVVAIASAFALASAGLLMLLGEFHLLPAPHYGTYGMFIALGIGSAVLYAAAVALGVEMLMRSSFSLLLVEEDRYHLLADNMTDVITRHGCDGAVLFASPTAQLLFGCGIVDLHGQGLCARVHVADRPAYLTALADAAAGERRSVEFRARREFSGGTGYPATQFIWIEMHCRRLEQAQPDAGGRDRREVVATLRDITERKDREQELEDARAQAARANAGESRVLATLSHELRTPLNAIIGLSDILVKEPAVALDARRCSEYAGLINESGHHLLAVVNDILDMSKIETDNFEIIPQPFAPAPVIARCCDLVALRANEAGVVLEQTPTGDLPEMVGDKRALHQILLNLLWNAIRLTDRGGRVAIGARAEAGCMTFLVEDSGAGISEEDLARIGEPYFLARASDDGHRGTGLEMSIVKGLVRLHGGEISICSRVGAGRRVNLRLPLDWQGARPHDRGGAEAPVEPTRRLSTRLPNNGAVRQTRRENAALPIDFRRRKSA